MSGDEERVSKRARKNYPGEVSFGALSKEENEHSVAQVSRCTDTGNCTWTEDGTKPQLLGGLGEEGGGGSSLQQMVEEEFGELSFLLGEPQAVQLIDSGEADLDAGDNEGQTPLHIACYKNYVGIVKQLVEAGADVTKGDKVGNTPLHTAAVTGAFSVVKYLLERGVPCDPQNLEGLTPLTLAERKAPPRNKAALLRLLREYEEKVREDGGDVTCRREGQAGSNHATGVSARANGNRTIDGTLAAAAAGTRSFGGGDDAGASDRGEGVLGQEMEAMDALSRALRRQQETIDRLTEVVQTQARTIADLVTEMGRRSAEERLPYAGGGGGGSGVDRNDVPDQEVEEVEEY